MSFQMYYALITPTAGWTARKSSMTQSSLSQTEKRFWRTSLTAKRWIISRRWPFWNAHVCEDKTQNLWKVSLDVMSVIHLCIVCKIPSFCGCLKQISLAILDGVMTGAILPEGLRMKFLRVSKSIQFSKLHNVPYTKRAHPENHFRECRSDILLLTRENGNGWSLRKYNHVAMHALYRHFSLWLVF